MTPALVPPRRPNRTGWIVSLTIVLAVCILGYIAFMTPQGRQFIGGVVSTMEAQTVSEETLVSPTPTMTRTPSLTPSPTFTATPNAAQMTATFAARQDERAQQAAATAIANANNAWLTVTVAVDDRDAAIRAAENAQATANAALNIQATAQNVAATAIANATAVYAYAQQQDIAALGRMVEADTAMMEDVFTSPNRYFALFSNWGVTNLISAETIETHVEDINITDGVFAIEATPLSVYNRNSVAPVSVDYCGMHFVLIPNLQTGTVFAQIVRADGLGQTYFSSRFTEMAVTAIIQLNEAQINPDILDMNTRLPQGARERVRTFVVLNVHTSGVFCTQSGLMTPGRRDYATGSLRSQNIADLRRLVVIDRHIEVTNYSGS